MSLRVLVVDDSAIMRRMVMRKLKRTGLGEFEFVEAGNGRDALEEFVRQAFDLILVDWNMPAMTGIEFVRRLREQGGTTPPVAMITTEKTVAARRQAEKDAGVQAYVTKPFTVEEIKASLAPLIERLVA